MKHALILAATAMVVIAGSQLVANGGAQSNLSIQRRVAILESKVKSLQKGQTTLAKAVVVLAERSDCLIATGYTAYGNPAGGTGYLYSSTPPYTVMTTALDHTASGDPVSDYVATIKSSCITTAKLSKGFRLAPMRPRTSLVPLRAALPQPRRTEEGGPRASLFFSPRDGSSAWSDGALTTPSSAGC